MITQNIMFFSDITQNPNEKSKLSYAGMFVFVYVISGELCIILPNQKLTVSPGEMAFIPPLLPRSFHVMNNEPVVTKTLSFRYWPNVSDLTFPPQVFLAKKIIKTFYEIKSLSDFPNIDAASISRVYKFIAKAERHLQKNSSKHFKSIEYVWQYMLENNKYSVSDLVKLSGLSRSRFYDSFLKVTNLTPIEAKHIIQALKAELLLKNTDLPIKEVANQLGFYSETNFRKVFQSRYDQILPHVFRKQR